MEKVRPWCGQPSDRGRLKNRTEQKLTILANFLVIVSFLDCNFSYYLVLLTNLFGIIVIVKPMLIFLLFVII